MQRREFVLDYYPYPCKDICKVLVVVKQWNSDILPFQTRDLPGVEKVVGLILFCVHSPYLYVMYNKYNSTQYLLYDFFAMEVHCYISQCSVAIFTIWLKNITIQRNIDIVVLHVYLDTGIGEFTIIVDSNNKLLVHSFLVWFNKLKGDVIY